MHVLDMATARPRVIERYLGTTPPSHVECYSGNCPSVFTETAEVQLFSYDEHSNFTTAHAAALACNVEALEAACAAIPSCGGLQTSKGLTVTHMAAFGGSVKCLAIAAANGGDCYSRRTRVALSPWG